MGKTAKEWYQHLPEPIRSQAMANWEGSIHYDKEWAHSSLHDALNLWDWDEYWVNIARRAQRGEFDQPEPNLHGWIAVTDRLPSDEGEYLVVDKNQNIKVSYFDKIAWGYLASIEDNIEFWQPLPKLPEVKGGENA